MSRRAFFLILLTAFSLSLLGALVFKEKAPEPKFGTLTLCARFCDNELVEALSTGEAEGTVDGAPCRILSVRTEASTVTREEGGVPLSFPSRLLSDVFFVLEVELTVKDGLPYAADAFLSPAKRVLLSSPFFYGECEILSIKVGKSG